MTETTETYTRQSCSIDLCPEVTNPGKVGCKLAELATELADIKLALNGPPDAPEKGYIHQGLAFFSEARIAEKKRWTRMQKLTLAGVIVAALGYPVGWCSINAYLFFKDVSHAVQELHEMHREHVQNPLPNSTSELYTARINNQQDAINQPHYQ